MVFRNEFERVQQKHVFFRSRHWVFIRIRLYFDGLLRDRLPTCLLKGLTVHRSLPIWIEIEIVRSVFGSLRSNVCYRRCYLFASSNDYAENPKNSNYYLGDLLRRGLNTIFSGGVSGVFIRRLGVFKAKAVQRQRSFRSRCFYIPLLSPNKRS